VARKEEKKKKKEKKNYAKIRPFWHAVSLPP
jgi:hypothetical protein